MAYGQSINVHKLENSLWSSLYKLMHKKKRYRFDHLRIWSWKEIVVHVTLTISTSKNIYTSNEPAVKILSPSYSRFVCSWSCWNIRIMMMSWWANPIRKIIGRLLMMIWTTWSQNLTAKWLIINLHHTTRQRRSLFNAETTTYVHTKIYSGCLLVHLLISDSMGGK